MRFEIQKSTKHGIECFERLGILYHEKNSKTNKTPTPTCTLYTSSGCIPHVTNDLIKFINNVPNILEVPLPSIIESRDSMIKIKKPIDKIIQMHDNLTLLTLKDSARFIKENKNEGKKLAVWSKRGGKTLCTTEEYNNLSASLAFDLTECPFDDLESSETKKRNQKSFARTKNYADSFFNEEPNKENRLGKILSLIGFPDLETRKFFIEHLNQSNYKFQGVVYHGFDKKETTMELADFKTFKETVAALNNDLSTDLTNTFKIFSFSSRPDQVLNAVELGFDIFSGSFPFVLTQQSHASLYEYKMEAIASKFYEEDSKNNGEEIPMKKQKISNVKQNSTEAFIDLKDIKYAEDFTKLKESCECYTCQNFTRAYLYHLVKVKEISAHTLIMIHNLDNYFGFFKEMRSAIETDRFQEYKKFISAQFF